MRRHRERMLEGECKGRGVERRMGRGLPVDSETTVSQQSLYACLGAPVCEVRLLRPHLSTLQGFKSSHRIMPCNQPMYS